MTIGEVMKLLFETPGVCTLDYATVRAAIRAHARAVAEAEREAIATMVESQAFQSDFALSHPNAERLMAAKIRARGRDGAT